MSDRKTKTISVDQELVKALAFAAIEKGTSIRELTERAIRAYLDLAEK